MSESLVGQTVGSYRVTKKLGEGGFGEVYVAEQTLIGKRVAVKFLKAELSAQDDYVKRFYNEARAATLIGHDGIVQVFDYGRHPSGCAYLVMELLEGESLSARLRRERRLPFDLIVALALQIAEALAAAHERNIIHRDLKPDNVFLTPVSPNKVPCGFSVKLLDFGIAKLTDADLHTQTGAVMGTPMYMSPEQCRGAGYVDHRSDVYSFGCILFEMVTGRWVFTGKGTGEFIAAHMMAAPQSPREIEPSIPVALEALILRCLQKDPAHRPQSMTEIIAELEQLPRTTGRPVAAAWPDVDLPATLVAPANAAPPPGETRGERPRKAPAVPPPPASPLAEKPVTTLGGAAAQSVAPVPARPARRRAVIAVGAIATVAAAVAVALAIGLGGRSKRIDAVPSKAHEASVVPAPSAPPAAAIAIDAGPPAAMVPQSPPIDAGVVAAPSPLAPPDAGRKESPSRKRTTKPGSRWEVKEGTP